MQYQTYGYNEKKQESSFDKQRDNSVSVSASFSPPRFFCGSKLVYLVYEDKPFLALQSTSTLNSMHPFTTLLILPPILPHLFNNIN